ncbi:MAG: hypothetical protein Q9218_004761 [Villophora microphyllina]
MQALYSKRSAERSKASAKPASPPHSGPASGVAASEPLTHTFSIHRIKSSDEYLIKRDDKQAVAYSIFRSCSFSGHFFSQDTPKLFIYRNAPSQSSTPREHHTDRNHPKTPLIATATISKRTLSISLDFNDRTVDLTTRNRGPWMFAREWQSPRGLMRWQYLKYGSTFKLANEEKELLGRWEADTGVDGKVCRLWVKAVDGDSGTSQQWMDEVLSVAMALYVANSRKG